MPPLLDIAGLNVGFGLNHVLHDVSIRVNDKERVGLFGPNGHGKTTLLETVAGLQHAWSGEIQFDEQAIQTWAPRTIVEHGLILVLQGSILFPRMTVQENLWLGSYSKGSWKKRRQTVDLVYDLFPRLAQRRSQLCRTLSGGERQMLAIGAGMMADARLLMLDEPTHGLAPKLKAELRDAIVKIGEAGVTLIVVEQDMAFLLSIADRLYMVQDGRVALETSEDLDREHILNMYFGGSSPGKPSPALSGGRGTDNGGLVE